MDEGNCKVFQGSIEDYKNSLFTVKHFDEAGSKLTSNKERRSPLKILQQKQRFMQKLEKEIAELEQQKQMLEDTLSSSYSLETYEQFKNCCQRLQELEDEWVEKADESIA